jgi:aldose 1-epimerase
VLDGYPEDAISPGGRGQVLAPWPNRLEDGVFKFGGLTARAALDEPSRSNAIHGLVRWLRWEIVERSPFSTRLGCRIAPQPGYPFALELSVGYELSADGLKVTSEAHCPGPTALPFGLGFHPYLTVGVAPIDTALLELPARTRLLLDERGLPAGSEPVAGTGYDFRAERSIGGIVLDDCFADLEPSDSGVVEVRLSAPDGSQGTVLWAEPVFTHIMCYTGDSLGDAPSRRRAVAIEPMTCPPNALRSGAGVITIEPQASWSASWGVRSAAGAPP